MYSLSNALVWFVIRSVLCLWKSS